MAKTFFRTICSVVGIMFAVTLAGTALAATVNVSVQVVQYECSDGIDNDADGFIDYPADTDCNSANDDSEVPIIYVCSDGIDNDADGLTDYPNDPGCDNALDNSEVNTQSFGESAGPSGGSFIATPATIAPASNQSSVVVFEGISSPGATIRILRNAAVLIEAQVQQDGSFRIVLPPQPTGVFSYAIQAILPDGSRSSLETFPIENNPSSQVDISDIVVDKFFTNTKGDLNGDDSVNLQDFSIAVFWLNRPLSPSVTRFEAAVLNNDGIISLVDLSIIAFYWTG